MNNSKRLIAIVGLSIGLSFAAHATPDQIHNISGNGPVTIGGINTSCSGYCEAGDSIINVNGDGNVTVNGKVEIIKGKDGVNGTNGTNGTNGKDGAAGAAGAKGEKGDKGERGEAGAAGTNGSNGADGKDGSNGKDADMSIVNGKVDKDAYAKDLASQAKKDAGQDSSIESLQGQTSSNKSAIEKETTSRISADDALGVRIDESNNNIANVGKLASETKDSLGRTDKRVADNTAAIRSTNQRIDGLEASTNSRFSSLKRDVEENKRRADAGIAGVAAMANIPQVTESARFSVGAGVGARGDESAVAVGFSSRITDGVIGKASIATDSQSEWTVGAGVAVQW